jgi:hypothetical protein
MDFAEADKHAWNILRRTFGCERSCKSRDEGYDIGTERSIEDFWKYNNFDPNGEVDQKDPWDWRKVTKELDGFEDVR